MTVPVRRGTSNRNERGSADERRKRRQWLLDRFGDGRTAPCAYDGCSTVVDILTLTVDRYPVPGCQGGTYRRDNIRPACATCNSTKGGALRRGTYDHDHSGGYCPLVRQSGYPYCPGGARP